MTARATTMSTTAGSASSGSRPVRFLVGVLALAVALTPALVGGAAEAKKRTKSSAPQFRQVDPPNTMYPVIGTKRVKDLATYSKRHRGTDIRTSCGATVRASTPGTAVLATNPKWGGRTLVRVVTQRNGLVSSYGWLWRPAVQQGQVIQSGQALGILAGNPFTKACTLYFSLTAGGKAVNPTSWLKAMVGKPATRWLFGTTGFNVASFNMLGASHTPARGFPSYSVRTPRALALLKARGIDVAGLQEFETRQSNMMMADPTYRAFNGAFRGGATDTRNAIIWRNSTMEFVSGELMPMQYFQGSLLQIPVVLLRQRSTGRTAYFINTHNPASGIKDYGDSAPYRAWNIAAQRAKVIQLRATGRPVFLLGDFNDRQAAFCPLTANKLMISPNSVPGLGCSYPRQTSIDWVFAAGQVRFSYFNYDRSPQALKIADHPLVTARAHLQN